MNIIHLNRNHLNKFRELMHLFAEVFDQVDTYGDHQPKDDYVIKLLNKKHIIHLIAQENNKVVGGLVAYVLEKFEQERSEIYIYDLAVASSHRRQGIATQLIEELGKQAKHLGAWVIFVQADYVDKPAIKLYESMGKKEDVLHFDIKI